MLKIVNVVIIQKLSEYIDNIPIESDLTISIDGTLMN